MQVGIDVVSIDRVADLVARSPRFVTRVFTAVEQRDCIGRPQRWASSWAAKEAVRKLCASSGAALPAFRDIEVVRDDAAGPRVRIGDVDAALALSLSHDRGLAIAVAASGDELSGSRQMAGSAVGVRLPPRPDDAHKGTFGRVLVVAGSRGYTGAPQLAALGAARAGAGLVTLCVPDAVYAIVAAGCLEVMPAPLPDGGAGVLAPGSLETLRERLRTADALVIGPGLGRATETEAALLDVLQPLPCPAVVDADALNIAAHRQLDWRRCAQPVVITPHPAEMARLAGLETAVVQADRKGLAARYAHDHGVVVVLKGAGTVIAAPDGRIHVDAHCVVALATGGTGDVLAGVIGSFIAQGLDTFDAAVAGVVVHAEAGMMVQARRGRAGALASDVVELLPAAQERLRKVIERHAQ
jgi:hydroxyethylthiazole kinase-like uncharacterized protein yjeF